MASPGIPSRFGDRNKAPVDALRGPGTSANARIHRRTARAEKALPISNFQLIIFN
jgi:hypothetical protein